MTITTEYRWKASHFIPGHPTCGQMHPHDWEISATIRRKPGYGVLTMGMIHDFKEVFQWLAAVAKSCGDPINDVVALPTCENLLVGWIVPRINDTLTDELELVSVRLWENEKYSCEWTK